MIQQIKAFAAQSDNLHSIPGLVAKAEKLFVKALFRPTKID